MLNFSRQTLLKAQNGKILQLFLYNYPWDRDNSPQARHRRPRSRHCDRLHSSTLTQWEDSCHNTLITIAAPEDVDHRNGYRWEPRCGGGRMNKVHTSKWNAINQSPTTPRTERKSEHGYGLKRNHARFYSRPRFGHIRLQHIWEWLGALQCTVTQSPRG